MMTSLQVTRGCHGMAGSGRRGGGFVGGEATFGGIAEDGDFTGGGVGVASRGIRRRWQLRLGVRWGEAKSRGITRDGDFKGVLFYGHVHVVFCASPQPLPQVLICMALKLDSMVVPL
ncbi:hypothetical protein TIFTF001_007522 [Ficus carica]|uniref:Uncharacterized protein n=1 Tax=Ficus carica TaxID=3494 RepID=A0AA87ZQI1_FICCA|nr:hypothetical protein TIFTF001_007522 [Ficus carica]